MIVFIAVLLLSISLVSGLFVGTLLFQHMILPTYKNSMEYMKILTTKINSMKLIVLHYSKNLE